MRGRPLSSARTSPVERYLEALHDRLRAVDEGAVADYIPELEKADPSWFGIALATVDGHVYEVGDTRQPFTIQSVSKPFVYGLALEDRGKARVLERIGVEPTGDAFNEISLAEGTGRPFNPMINAGAITATSLVAGHSPEDRWERIQGLFSIYAGRRLEMSQRVYECERETGHRNRAISHMLRSFGILEDDPELPLDLYFRQCSVELTCRDLAVMAATLATGGFNPVTRERALHPANVDEVLSVMTTCGMYDSAGEWVYRIGMPAKSGVAGGILAVLPGQLGIGVFSPPLDRCGNSVRGVAACEALSDDLELHFLRAPRVALSTVRSRSSLRSIRSKRMRSDRECEVLDELGHRAALYRLQGDLTFPGIELLARRVVAERVADASLVLDLSEVRSIDGPAARFLLELVESRSASGGAIAFVGLDRHPRVLRFLEESQQDDGSLELTSFGELDLAIEWCEEQLLAEIGAGVGSRPEVPIEKHELLAGLDRHEIEALRGRMERRDFPRGRLLVRIGEPADELFLITRGELSVLTDTSQGHLHRLSTLSAGMCFGEQFLVEDASRTAFVRADRDSTCWTLSRRAFRALVAAEPRVEGKLLESLLRSSSRIIHRLTLESTARSH